MDGIRTKQKQPDQREDGPTTAVVQDGHAALVAFTRRQVEIARAYVEASRSASTRAKYLQHWRRSTFGATPTSTRRSRRTRRRSPSTCPTSPPPAWCRRHLRSGWPLIGYAHCQAGEAVPHKAKGGTVILGVLARARRRWGKPPHRKAAADGDVIWSMLHAIKGDALRNVRDGALLSLGMVSCLRRSEITALDVPNIVRAPEGLHVTIRRSKGDQEGAGAAIAIPAARHLKPVQVDSRGRRTALRRAEAMAGRRRSDRALRKKLRSPGRPGVARREDRRQFWALIADGLSGEDAAMVVGISQPAGFRWFRVGGGMAPSRVSRSLKPLSGR